ncbi:MAG TPA: ATP-dependent DNA ligase [Abditibacteriaceae bacterium]|jgi:DNA ligase-1
MTPLNTASSATSSTQTSSAFLAFAQTAERIAATTKRLEKAALLGEYFTALCDADLLLAARYFAGYLFSLRDQRTANVGGAALISSILTVTGSDEAHFRTRLVTLGDAGDAAFEAFHASSTKLPEATLTLQDIAAFLDELSATSGSKRKVELLTQFLGRATPLEAKYIVKLLQGDLRIGLREGAVEDAVARASNSGVGSVQRCNMLLGDIGETSVLARHNALHTARMRLFHPLKFMLASPAADLSDVARGMPPEFIVEDKFDGIRAQAHIAPHVEGDAILHGVEYSGRRIALFSRTLDEITHSFPDLVAPLAALLPHSTTTDDGLILDGEIVPVRGENIAPFQELQKRLGRKTLSDELRADVPVAFIAYDLLFARNRVLMEEPLSERRKVLESLPFDAETARVAASRTFCDVAQLDEEFEAARARGNEGLMTKDPRSQYKPGRRGREWLKIKRALATLDVVVTAVEVGNGRRSKFLSDYTFAVRAAEDDPTLLNVGKAYSGLTDQEIMEMSEWFRAHTIQEFAHGKVRVVEPQIVIEVTFDNVQPSKRHKSGYALRFPRILRLRPDKPAAQIDTLDTVRRLAGETTE